MLQQHYDRYTAQDQLVWKVLFDRQTALLHKRACQAFADGLQRIGFHRNAIPNFEETSERLRQATGWQLEPVAGMLNDAEFFGLLAQRKFPATVWIRSMEQFDFIEVPDLFHGVFGHVPLLMDKAFADFLHFLGHVAAQHLDDAVALERLDRLYGFTVQFGLVEENGSTRMYGAGLLSSSGEIHHCIADDSTRRPFDLGTVLDTPYSEAHLQDQYFVLPNWEQLTGSVAELAALLASDWEINLGKQLVEIPRNNKQ
jgi:phenylalanine-4-hydroxylase